MAANNYFGFTHGAAQYSAQATTAYPAAAQTAYVQPAAATAYATPRPAYDTYSTSHAAAAAAAAPYAYATRTQVVAAPAYDATKTYYAATAAAPAAAAAAVYTVAETPYQAYITGGSIPVTLSSSTAKPAYVSATYATTPTPARQAAVVKTQPVSPASAGTYIYANTAASAAASAATYGATSNSSSYSTGYDAALYSAATNYYQQQQTPRSGAGSTVSSGGGGTSWQAKRMFAQKMRPRAPPKQPELHYCEVCKISCAGPQTYREHLEGQKHKKKEQALKLGNSAGVHSSTSARSLQNQLKCELCDVACTGSDAYSAHIRGAKHQKVLKLHQKLGKPIPSTEPQIAGATSSSAGKGVATSKVTGSVSTKLTTTTSADGGGMKKVVATPKITFVGGALLKTTGAKQDEAKTETKADTTATAKAENEEKGYEVEMLLPGEKDVQPVGHEYIDEVRNELGVCVSFHCKLCDCKFNDPNAKIMHMKGRRHRLQYKKKVDPNLQVEIKPSMRMDRMRRHHKEEFWRRREHEERWHHEEMRMMYANDMYYGGGTWQGRGGMQDTHYHGPPHGNQPNANMRRPDTIDDRYVMAKHASIYPNEAELAAVQKIVSACEKSLKHVSDFLTDSDAPKVDEKVKEEPKEDVKSEKESAKTGDKPLAPSAGSQQQQQRRTLKGVMRVDVLAKGLLLHDDLRVRLVVVCAEKPTRTLLVRVADNLPKQLQMPPEEKCEVKICVEEAAVVVTVGREPATSCTITFTSPEMRDENNLPSAGDSASDKADPPDVLDRQKCLQALAALRHAKWFQARAHGLPSCLIVIRILRDLCKRVPTWAHLNQWAIELLAEKCVSSGGQNMSPGDALRRIFECIASGILLPGGPGLQDPCEKEATDAAASLTNQQREDITASAQHALRLLAFRQTYKVLGMDPLSTQTTTSPSARLPRKRRLVSSNGDGDTVEDGSEGKKDKRDGKAETVTSSTPQAS